MYKVSSLTRKQITQNAAERGGLVETEIEVTIWTLEIMANKESMEFLKNVCWNYAHNVCNFDHATSYKLLNLSESHFHAV